MATTTAQPPAVLKEHELIRRVKAGSQRALQQLVNKHTGLIRNATNKYDHLADRDVLMAAGALAVDTAAQRFDFEKGTKFVTYLSPLVQDEVRAAYCRESGISRDYFDNLKAISQASSQLYQELNREPTLGEISERSELSPLQIRNAWEVKQFARQTSLNQMVREGDEDGELITFQMDVTVDPWSTVEQDERLNTLESLESAGHLQTRQVEAVLDRGAGFSTTEIGEKIGVCSERVRQLFKATQQTIADFREGLLTLEPIPAVQPVNVPVALWPVRIDASRLGGRIGRFVARVVEPIKQLIAPIKWVEVKPGERVGQPLNLGVASNQSLGSPSLSLTAEDDFILSSKNNIIQPSDYLNIQSSRHPTIHNSSITPSGCPEVVFTRGPTLAEVEKPPYLNYSHRSGTHALKNNVVRFSIGRRSIAVASTG